MSKRFFEIRIKWGVSRGRDTLGYTTCSLYDDGKRVAACNGGGYDMTGTVLGDWIAKRFPEKLRKLKLSQYGLTFHNPKRKTPATIEQAEASGRSLGLERYQDFYAASSKVPTEVHTVPLIDGACGQSSVERILTAIGGTIKWTKKSSRLDIAEVEIDDDFDIEKVQGLLVEMAASYEAQRNAGKDWSKRKFVVTVPLIESERNLVERSAEGKIEFADAATAA